MFVRGNEGTKGDVAQVLQSLGERVVLRVSGLPVGAMLDTSSVDSPIVEKPVAARDAPLHVTK